MVFSLSNLSVDFIEVTMKRFRIGNDIRITWEITKKGQPAELEGKAAVAHGERAGRVGGSQMGIMAGNPGAAVDHRLSSLRHSAPIIPENRRERKAIAPRRHPCYNQPEGLVFPDCNHRLRIFQHP